MHLYFCGCHSFMVYFLAFNPFGVYAGARFEPGNLTFYKIGNLEVTLGWGGAPGVSCATRADHWLLGDCLYFPSLAGLGDPGQPRPHPGLCHLRPE